MQPDTVRVRARRARLIVGELLIAVLTAACGSGQQATAGSPIPLSPLDASGPPSMAPTMTTAPVPECRAADLTLAVARSEGAAGHVYRTLQFTNRSEHRCVMQGYPGVSFVADDGHQIGPAAVREGPIGTQVTVDPGASAVAVVDFTDTGVFNPDTCRPTQVRGLRVYPPDERTAIDLPLPGTGCAATTPSAQLHVRTITPG